jgi:hypothetical protein
MESETWIVSSTATASVNLMQAENALSTAGPYSARCAAQISSVCVWKAPWIARRTAQIAISWPGVFGSAKKRTAAVAPSSGRSSALASSTTEAAA